VVLKIFDLFFLKGSEVLFKTCLAIFHEMRREILSINDFGELFVFLDSFPKNIEDAQALFDKFDLFDITNEDIWKLRKQMRSTFEKDLQMVALLKEEEQKTCNFLN